MVKVGLCLERPFNALRGEIRGNIDLINTGKNDNLLIVHFLFTAVIEE